MARTGETPDGGGSTCSESTIGASPNPLGIHLATAKQSGPKAIFGLLMEVLGNNLNNGIYVDKRSAIPNTNDIRYDIIEGGKEAGGPSSGRGAPRKATTGRTIRTQRRQWARGGVMDFTLAIGAESILAGRPKPEFAVSNLSGINYVTNHPSHPDW